MNAKSDEWMVLQNSRLYCIEYSRKKLTGKNFAIQPPKKKKREREKMAAN